VLLREAGVAGMVLARNAGAVLPLRRERLRRVAVLGANAVAARTQGGGSATVNPDHVVSPLDGLRAALGPGVEVTHAVGARLRHVPEPVGPHQVRDPVSGQPGLRVRYHDAAGAVLHDERRLAGRLVWIGEPVVAAAAAIEIEALLSVDEPGTYRVGAGGVGRLRLEAAGEVLVDEPDLRPEPGADPFAAVLDPPQGVAEVELAPGREVPVRIRHELGSDRGALSLSLGLQPPALGPQEELEAAVRLAADADAAIVVVGTTDAIESEGFDRTTLALPGDQDELVRRVAAVNGQTVVVVNSGGPVLLPWRDEVPAVLLTWFGGQEFGAALADVLLGDAEPGGRLPTTWPARQEDVPVLSTTPVGGALEYAEGLHVGYRAWARAGIAPAFAFGHGLGYTEWELDGLEAPATAVAGEPVVVRVAVRNAGPRAGRHVVQAYLSRPASAVERPLLWLAGFAAVRAPHGAEARAELTIDPRAFAHWDAARGTWAVEPGPFELRVGPSAAEQPLRATIEVASAR
jgi:beta-glucosidase